MSGMPLPIIISSSSPTAARPLNAAAIWVSVSATNTSLDCCGVDGRDPPSIVPHPNAKTADMTIEPIFIVRSCHLSQVM
jgi:hypothetical protein